MKKEAADRRVRKTKKILRQCLVQLMKEKKIQQITVKELTDMADLNRGTFYLHYRDVFDLLEQLENEMFDEFNQVIDRYRERRSTEEIPHLFEEVYDFILKNQDLATILLVENGDFNFMNRLRLVIRDKCLNDWGQLFSTADPSLFMPYYAFIVSGCVGLVQYWIRNGFKETPRELAGITEQIIIHGIKVLDS